MKPVWMYLNEAAERGIVKNDTELGIRLGVGRSAVCEWRKGRSAPNEDQSAALADLLGKPEVMAECMAARAKRPETRAMWERAARTLSMTVSFAGVAVVNLLLTASPAKAAPLLEITTKALCIMSTWRACLNRDWRRRPRAGARPAAGRNAWP